MIGLHPTSEEITIGNNLSTGFGVVDFDLTIENFENTATLKNENQFNIYCNSLGLV